MKLGITQPYFSPIISQFPTYRGLESAQPEKMPVAEKVTLFHCSTIPLFHHSTVPPFHRSTIPPFHRSTIPPFHRSTFPLFHHSTIIKNLIEKM
jgi:hypothetical protein